MKPVKSAETMRGLVDAWIQASGGLKLAADSINVSPSYLVAVRDGKAAIGPKILQLLGYRRLVVYEKIT